MGRDDNELYPTVMAIKEGSLAATHPNINIGDTILAINGHDLRVCDETSIIAAVQGAQAIGAITFTLSQRRKPLAVGDRVTVAGYESQGTVRFIGPHAIHLTPRVLVQLDQPIGKNNGTVSGHVYCDGLPENTGVLVVPAKVTQVPEPLILGPPSSEATADPADPPVPLTATPAGWPMSPTAATDEEVAALRLRVAELEAVEEEQTTTMPMSPGLSTGENNEAFALMQAAHEDEMAKLKAELAAARAENAATTAAAATVAERVAQDVLATTAEKLARARPSAVEIAAAELGLDTPVASPPPSPLSSQGGAAMAMEPNGRPTTVLQLQGATTADTSTDEELQRVTGELEEAEASLAAAAAGAAADRDAARQELAARDAKIAELAAALAAAEAASTNAVTALAIVTTTEGAEEAELVERLAAAEVNIAAANNQATAANEQAAAASKQASVADAAAAAAQARVAELEAALAAAESTPPPTSAPAVPATTEGVEEEELASRLAAAEASTAAANEQAAAASKQAAVADATAAAAQARVVELEAALAAAEAATEAAEASTEAAEASTEAASAAAAATASSRELDFSLPLDFEGTSSAAPSEADTSRVDELEGTLREKSAALDAMMEGLASRDAELVELRAALQVASATPSPKAKTESAAGDGSPMTSSPKGQRKAPVFVYKPTVGDTMDKVGRMAAHPLRPWL